MQQNANLVADAFSAGQIKFVGLLEMLLRLRQCCDSIDLLPAKYCDESFDFFRSAQQENSSILWGASGRANDGDSSSISTAEPSDGDVLSGQSDRARLTQLLLDQCDDTCGKCQSPIREACVTPCAHFFCESCIMFDKKCPTCGERFSRAKLVTQENLRAGAALRQRYGGEGKAGKAGKAAGASSSAAASSSSASSSSAAAADATPLSERDRTLRSRSSKMYALLDLLRRWQRHDPTYKVVLFSQWTSMLDLIEDQLRVNNVRFSRLDGTMRAQTRRANMMNFADDPGIKVFLVSLKAGGVGINLTCANKVILFDPWWNPAVEEQAIDRIHRLGQTRQVEVVRFIVTKPDKSVEMRVVRLQQKKSEMSKHVLSRVGGKRAMRLDANDHLSLLRDN